MAIKDLFSGEQKILSSTNLSGSTKRGDISSVKYAQIHKDNKDRFIPVVNFSTPENFVFYGSAEQYYADAFSLIQNRFPYDGAYAEREEWYGDLSHFERYIFEEVYPRTTGFICLGNTYSATGTKSTAGFVSSSAPEYIYIKGGPHTDPNKKDLKRLFPSNDGKANYFKEDGNKKWSNLTFDLSGSEGGSSVEFWLNKSGWTASNTAEAVFDLWNGAASGSADYGRCTLYLDSENADKMYLHAQSGSAYCNATLDTGLTTLADGGWHHYAVTLKNHHTDNFLEIDFYRDGSVVSKGKEQILGPGSPAGFNDISGTLNATIGALVTAFSGEANSAKGYGKLSASLDEFRYWKTERTDREIGRYWFTHVEGGANERSLTSSLGVYYKFNEGITEDQAADSTVLDYSGRLSNGDWVGFITGSSLRQTGSAQVLAQVTDSEYRDPILYKAHPDVSSKYTKLIDDAVSHDNTNPSGIYSSIPEWITTEDLDTNGEVLKKLTQLIAGYFDEMQHLIRELPRIKEKSYRYLRPLPSGSAKPLPFASSLLEQSGFISPEIFIDADILAQLMSRDEEREFSDTLHNIKNSIYQNIYNNLVHIYKSKGTEKAFRNLFRCFGIDHELLKINLYASDTTYEYKDNYRASSYKKTFVDFNSPDRHGSIVYQQTSSTNSNSVSYIEGFTGGQVGVPMTFEAEVIFPFKPKPNSKLYLPYVYFTSSIFGVHTAVDNQADLSWAGTDYSFAVLAVREVRDSPNVRFALSSSLTSSLIMSDTYYDVYDGEKWNFAVRVKPSEYPLGTHAFGTTDQDYTLEFYGVQANSSVAQKEFSLGSPISNALGSGFLKSKKRVFIGSDRIDTTGSQRFYSDVKVSSVAAWAAYLSASVIQSHAFDPGSFGIDEPHKNAFLMSVEGTPVTDAEFVPRAKSLILHWDFSSVTGSGAPNSAGYGTFAVEDLSSGSSKPGYSGEFAPILEKQHTAIGDRFLPRVTNVVNTEFLSAAEKRLPEVLNSSDMVKILTQDDVQFTRDSRPANQLMVIEKSMYQTVSEDMINLFASVKDFNNLVGEPVNRYRQNYKEMENLRSLYFDRIGNTPDLEKFLEYYKWIDSSISKMAEKLIPASANMSEGIKTVVEEYALGARSKYHTKFPTMEFKEKIPEASMRGIDELTYNWKFGHAPVPGDGANAKGTITIVGDDGDELDTATITITSTDGTRRIYTFSDATASNTPVAGTGDIVTVKTGGDDSEAAIAERLENAIEHSIGHGGRILVSRAGAVLTLTQAVRGSDGNTAIVMDIGELATRVDFAGGSVDHRQDVNSLWWKERSDRDRGLGRDKIRSVATSDNSGSWIPYKLADSNRTLYDGSTYAKRALLKPYKIDLIKSKELHGGHNFHENKRIGISQTAFLSVDANHPIKLILNPFSSGSIITRDVWNPSEKKRLDAMVVGSSAGSGKSNHLMPFSLYSSSIDSGDFGGVEGEHVEITNMHHDGYGIRGEVPMQGPFTETHVGGRQHRHVIFGTGSDNVRNREEGFRVKFNTTSTEHGVSHAEVIGGYDKLNPQSPAAPFMRDEYAKRPINIRNIKSGTPEYAKRLGNAAARLTKVDAQLRLGNYEKKYQILQTSGRSKNNSVFKNRRTLFDDILTTRTNNDVVYNLPESGIISGTVDFERPQRTGSLSNKHVFVERFSSPGDPAAMGDSHGGPGLDIIAGEFSVYNTMNYRNKLVRDTLNKFEQRHSIFGGLEVPKSGSTNYLYPTMDHGIQQNKFRNTTGELTYFMARSGSGAATRNEVLSGAFFGIFDGTRRENFYFAGISQVGTDAVTGSSGDRINLAIPERNPIPVTLIQLSASGGHATGTIDIGTVPGTDVSIRITSTDGTMKTYTSKGANDYADNEFRVTGLTTTEAAGTLKGAIEHSSGHGDRFGEIRQEGSTLYLTQFIRGTAGNNLLALTGSWPGCSVTGFAGGGAGTAALGATDRAEAMARVTTAISAAFGDSMDVTWDGARKVTMRGTAASSEYSAIPKYFPQIKIETNVAFTEPPDGSTTSLGRRIWTRESQEILFFSGSARHGVSAVDSRRELYPGPELNFILDEAARYPSDPLSTQERISYHKSHRNTRKLIKTDIRDEFRTGSVTEIHDNRFVRHMIPANDFQYSWITASHLPFDVTDLGDKRTNIPGGYAAPDGMYSSSAGVYPAIAFVSSSDFGSVMKNTVYGVDFGFAGRFWGTTFAGTQLSESSDRGWSDNDDNAYNHNFVRTDFVGLNTNIAEPISSSTNTVGFDSMGMIDPRLILGRNNYVNNLFVSGSGGASNSGPGLYFEGGSNVAIWRSPYYHGATKAACGEAATFNALMLHRNGAYGYPSWKQIRAGEHSIARAHKKQNIISVMAVPELKTFVNEVTQNGSTIKKRYTVKAKRRSEFENYVEPALTSKYFPMETSVITEDSAIQVGPASKEPRPTSPTTVIHTYGNNLGAFANPRLTYRFEIGEAEEQTYDKLKELYLDGLVDAGSNPVRAFNYHLYKETVYPREINTYLKKTRGRENYTETHLSYSYGRTTDNLTFWKDDELQRVRLTSSDNPEGSYSAMPHEPIAETVFGRTLMRLSASTYPNWAYLPHNAPAADAVVGYGGAGVTPGNYAFTSSYWLPASVWDLDAESPYAALVFPTGSRLHTGSTAYAVDDALAMYTPALGLCTSSHDPNWVPIGDNPGVTGSALSRNPMQVVGSRKYPWWVTSSLGKYEALTALNGILCSEGRAVQEFYMGGIDDSLEGGRGPWSSYIPGNPGSVYAGGGAHGPDDAPFMRRDEHKQQRLQAGLSFEFLQWVPNWLNVEGIQPFNSSSVSGDLGTREYDHYIPRYRTNKLAGRNPWFDSYEEYLDDIRCIAKDHTILPEFRISDHLDYYLNTGKRRSGDVNRAWLTLPGASLNASASAGSSGAPYNENIFKEYSHSDFMSFFGDIQEDHEEVSEPVVMRLQVQGVKKLLPYKGFYPSQRTVQIAQLFSESFARGMGEECGITAFNQPLFGPGVLFNSIKSGIACDWLTYTSSLPKENDGWGRSAWNADATSGMVTYSKNPDVRPKHNPLMDYTRGQAIRHRTEPGHYEPTFANRTGSLPAVAGRHQDYGRLPNSGSAYFSLDLNPSYRLPFEALVEPAKYFPRSPAESRFKIRNNVKSKKKKSRKRTGLCYIPPQVPGLYFNSKYNQYPVTGTFNGKHDAKYGLAMNNFLAESAKFFLEDGTFTSFASKPEKDFETMVSGTSYYMDVVLRKTEDLVMYEGPDSLGCWYPSRTDYCKALPFNDLHAPGVRGSGSMPRPYRYSEGSSLNYAVPSLGIGDECTGSHIRAEGPYMFLPDFNSARGMHYGPSMRAFSASFLNEMSDAFPLAGDFEQNAHRIWAVWSKNFTDPSFAPYTPPYFYGDAIARIKFTPHKHYPMSKGEAAKFTLDEVLAGARKETFFINENERAFKALDPVIKSFTGAGEIASDFTTGSNVANSKQSVHAATVQPIADVYGNSLPRNIRTEYHNTGSSRTGSIGFAHWLTASNFQDEFNGFATPEGSSSYEDTSLARRHQMKLDSSMQLFGKTRQKVVSYDSEGDVTGLEDAVDSGLDVWSIYSKWECPVLDFSENNTTMEFWASGAAAPGNNFNRDLTGVATRGMWKGYGQSPVGSDGIFLELKESFANVGKEENTKPALAGTDTKSAPSGSLLKVLGFESQQKRVGQVRESKIISEAIVAIPFYRSAICPDEPEAMRFFVLGDDPVESRALFNVAAGDSAADLNPGDSIIEMAERMENYVIPPHLDFYSDATIEPFAMYIFPFTHELSKEDLENIWQGIMPDISVTAEKGVSSLSHNFGENEFFRGRPIPSDTRWMVFKVKQRAEVSYSRVIDDTKDDTRFEFDFDLGTANESKFNYNWPYDYFSLVELGRVDATVRIGGEPLEPARPPMVKPQNKTLETAMASRVQLAAQAAGIESAVKALDDLPDIPVRAKAIMSPAAPAPEISAAVAAPAKTPVEKIVARTTKKVVERLPRDLRIKSEKVFTNKIKADNPKATAAGWAKGAAAVGAGLPARKDRIEASPKTVKKIAVKLPKRPRAPRIPFKF